LNVFGEYSNFLKSSYSPQTLISYQKALKSLSSFIHNNVSAIDDTTLEKFTEHLSNKGLSANTIQLTVKGAHNFIKWANRNKYISTSLSLPKLPKVQETIRYSLSGTELSMFVKHTNYVPEPYSTALKVLAFTGMRLNEMTNLARDSVTVANGYVIFTINTEKTGKVRLVPMLKQGNPYFKNYLASYLNDYIRNANVEVKWLFPSRFASKHISGHEVERYLREIGGRMRTSTTAQVLRRTFATLLSNKGVPTVKISKMLGHSSEKMTTGHYISPRIEDLTSSLSTVTI